MPRDQINTPDLFRLHPDTATFVGEIQHKYMLPHETWSDANLRVAEALFVDASDRAALLQEIIEKRACPAGRVLAGAGSDKNVTWWNCFVAPLLQDSMRTDSALPGQGIMDALAAVAFSMQMGGGVGTDFSPLRPEGALVRRLMASASGPLAFMYMWDAMCRTIMSAGYRRGAMMGTIRCDHADVRAFIRAKHDPAQLRMFNMSVLITDAFMRAVKIDAIWELGHWEPPFDPTKLLDTTERAGRPWYVYERLPARLLWNELMESTYRYAEPGVIFIDRINQANNLWYCEDIQCTNPCVVGETLIYVAGRGPTSIADLAKDGQDIPVYSCNEKTGEIMVRWGRKPRLTKRMVPIVKIKLDDGTSLRVTNDHLFPLRSGNRVRAIDLCYGDSLYRFDAVNTKQDGVVIGLKSERRLEYHLVAEAKYGQKFDFGRNVGQFNVHHLDDDHFNNAWNNIEVLTVGDHSAHHRTGDANPMRAWWSVLTDEEKNTYRVNMARATSGANNGMFGRKHSETTLQKIGAKTTDRFKDHNFREKHSAAVRAGAAKMTPEARARNHKVVSVIPDGFEDVYNLTVDEYHNYAIITGETTTPRWNNLHYSGVFACNCGEQPLPPDANCNLSHVNLSRCVVGDLFTDGCGFDFTTIERVTRLLVRMSDNVIDLSPVPTEAQAAEGRRKRRIGLGITGLANALMFLRRRYGSSDAIAAAEAVMITIRDAAYRESVEIAREKGPFPAFERDRYLKGEFIQTLPQDIRDGIAEYGIRNALLLTVAPTGTVSIAQADNSSGGLEPVFLARYRRKVLQPDNSFKESIIEDFGFRVYANALFDGNMDAALAAPLPDYMVTTVDLTPEDHLLTQAAVQRYIDASVSKTINVPTDTPFEVFTNIYKRAYELGCKGCTTYREVPDSGRGSVLSAVDAPDTDAPLLATIPLGTRVRPEVLDARTYRLRWASLPYPMFLTIGDEVLEDGRRIPFECFINSKAVDYAHWVSALTRMISAVMRKGGDLTFIPDELKAVWSARGGEFINKQFVPSEVALIGLTLERHFRDIGYIKNVEPAASTAELALTGVHYAELGIGRQCSSCGALQVVRAEGCEKCLACGWSNCG